MLRCTVRSAWLSDYLWKPGGHAPARDGNPQIGYMYDWGPTRDLQGADPVCAHCHTCFADKAAFRQHITRGQCKQFGPAKPAELLPVHPEWQQVVKMGTINSLRQAPMSLVRLTPTCGLKLERLGDLMLHLQTVHSACWSGATANTHLLIKVYQHRDGCCCNPSRSTTGATHICPMFRQIAMLEQRVEHDLFVPWTFDADMMHAFLQRTAANGPVQMIVEYLTQRAFNKLWTDPACITLFTTRCLV